MKLYEKSERIMVDRESKFVLMSDLHRGDGSGADDFVKNRAIVDHALSYYYQQEYTYIELGDGDELWKNRHMDPITKSHKNLFGILERFAKKGRFYMLYGNHDLIKRRLSKLYQRAKRLRHYRFLHSVAMQESLILDCPEEGWDIFLIHGHQVDFMNNEAWMLARFLVRYVWRPMQSIGIQDPFSSSDSEEKAGIIGMRLSEWARKQGKMLIAGHTHQHHYPDKDEPLYFNDGCCIYAHSITAIEIKDNQLTLVRWHIATRQDGSLYVRREVLNGPDRIADLYSRIASGNMAPSHQLPEIISQGVDA